MRRSTPLILNYWLWCSVALLLGTISVFELRTNNLRAVELRNQVLVVDKANGDVEKALRDLRGFVYSHMNANLSSGTSVYPPVQLKYRYDRLVAAEKARIPGEMAKVYADAPNACAGQSGAARAQCLEAYITSHTVTERPINEDLYKFDFVAPVWSPDKAGITMVLAGLAATMGLMSIIIQQWMKGRLL